MNQIDFPEIKEFEEFLKTRHSNEINQLISIGKRFKVMADLLMLIDRGDIFDCWCSDYGAGQCIKCRISDAIAPFKKGVSK